MENNAFHFLNILLKLPILYQQFSTFKYAKISCIYSHTKIKIHFCKYHKCNIYFNF